MALHVAAQNGRVEVIYHLIKAGCDVNAKNDVSNASIVFLLSCKINMDTNPCNKGTLRLIK